MKLARLSFLVLISVCSTSCSQTWNALKNTYPVRILDQAGSEVLGLISENNLPTDGKPASMLERARQIESRGNYAGKVSAASVSSHQRTASR
jgi:hypothetical protein